MSGVHFTATRLVGTGKKGILKPDENGYYTMAIGGLNCFNSAGQYYTLDGAKQLFESSSVFMRRVKGGNLKGEVGHPRMLPGMTEDDFVARIIDVYEPNICCHFSEIWLDEEFGKKNPQYKNPSLVGIMSKLRPAGPKADFLKDALENSQENVNFSIRAKTRNYYERGQCIRVLTQIFTFDCVNEPGIAHANKWASPALEDINETVINSAAIQRVADRPSIFATEDSRAMLRDMVSDLKQNKPGTPPRFSNW